MYLCIVGVEIKKPKSAKTSACWAKNGNFYALVVLSTHNRISQMNLTILFRNIIAFILATIFSLLVVQKVLDTHDYEEQQRIERVNQHLESVKSGK